MIFSFLAFKFVMAYRPWWQKTCCVETFNRMRGIVHANWDHKMTLRVWIRTLLSLQHVVWSVRCLNVAAVVVNNAEPLVLSHTLLSQCFLQRNMAEWNTAVSVYMWLVLLKIVSVVRRAAAAVSAVASCQADSRRSPAATDPLELILSSQGSPVIGPPTLVPVLLGDSKKHCPPGNVVATSASAVISVSCWVLFGVEDLFL